MCDKCAVMAKNDLSVNKATYYLIFEQACISTKLSSNACILMENISHNTPTTFLNENKASGLVDESIYTSASKLFNISCLYYLTERLKNMMEQVKLYRRCK